MSNINRKKLAKRLTKTNLKQLPLTNLYILVLIILAGIAQLTYSMWIGRLCRIGALILMVYYIHNKTVALDYLVCNVVKVGLIAALAAELVKLSSEQQANTIAKFVKLGGLVLYFMVFNIKQPIGRRTTSMILFLLMLCGALVTLEGSLAWHLWGTANSKPIERGVLTLLLSSALLRYNNTSPRSYMFLVIGATLFAGSELIGTMLAYNNIESRFALLLGAPAVLVGHYLIMHGSVLHCNLQDAIDKLRDRAVY